MNRLRNCIPVALLCYATALGACASAAGNERVIERTVPAGKARELVVKASVGDIRVVTGGTDDVVLRLQVKAKEYRSWLLVSRQGDPSQAELVAETAGDALRFELRYPGDRDGIEEDWSLEVPARLAARITLGVGSVRVRGIAGGVLLKVNVGEIEAEVPGGNIEAEVNVGDIRATTGSNSYERIRLDANVGDAKIIGADSGAVRHSSGYGPGSSASLDGDGRDRIRLEVNVGDASLSIRGAH
ncbi:MAG: hypothetical protein ACRD5F_09205 [Candidatus Acidiferrales bacterium]